MKNISSNIDWHIHTLFSPDGQATVDEYCERAIEIGLDGVGFSDHFDLSPDDTAFGFYRYEDCRDAVVQAREKYGGRLKIYHGVEVGYEASYGAGIRKFLETHGFDYRIGSNHCADGNDYSKTNAAARCLKGVEGRERYSPYFRELLAAARSGLFHILGHFDVLKRFDPADNRQFKPEDFQTEIRAILSAVIQNGMALEINTAGFRQHPKESFPGEFIVTLYRELGGRKICLSSDSHKLRHLATRFDETRSWLQEMGFGEDRYFRPEFLTNSESNPGD